MNSANIWGERRCSERVSVPATLETPAVLPINNMNFN